MSSALRRLCPKTNLKSAEMMRDFWSPSPESLHQVTIYPLIEVGVMELDENPENCFADIEQAAFSPANVVIRATGRCSPASSARR